MATAASACVTYSQLGPHCHDQQSTLEAKSAFREHSQAVHYAAFVIK
jgi:hypothetical protein